MGLGAILVVGAGTGTEGRCSIACPGGKESLLAEPVECVDILGRSMLERTVERFTRADVDAITLMVPNGYSVPTLAGKFGNLSSLVVSDVNFAIAQQLSEYLQIGIDHSFVASANLYTETDLLDLFYFHREARQAATRGMDRAGSLALWVVDCAKAEQIEIEGLLTRSGETGASYFIPDNVTRLNDPSDLRRLVSDALSGRCAMRPSGREIKPGIWVEDGTEIHRGARLVAPAFVGAGSRVEEDTLITRCSSIEKGCYVDCGTVIEDSSILANTHVGIWLDLCHAVVNGNRLLSLAHQVVVEISDPSILRFSGAIRHEVHAEREHQSAERQIVAANQQQPPTSETCGLEPILSRGD